MWKKTLHANRKKLNQEERAEIIMKAVNIRTEYLTDPIGIDVKNPRISWTCEGGKKQSAYQVISDNWDSGKVESSSMHVNYPADLKDRERVDFSVKLWDENDEEGEPCKASFEMGISCFEAKWITGNYKVKKSVRYPVDCFRKLFSAHDIKSARLYITACGVYEAKINGVKAGDFVLAPGITDYRVRVQYQTYDVTDLIKSGDNEITIQLADGWFRGSVGAWGLRNEYGTETKLLAQLEITSCDGRTEIIATDDSWDWSNDGPIRLADNKDGEVYNANDLPSYKGKAKLTAHNVVPSASNNVWVREKEQFKPKKIRTPKGYTVLDFGQNIAGYISFKVDAKKGQRIKLLFGEMLDKDGEFSQKNIQLSNKKKTTPLQQIIYTCADGVNEYKTTFAIFGFQYVQIETEIPVDPEDYTAIAVYSDMEETSRFECSNELLNRFYESTVWSAKNNSCDLPTDCPTRERHGWSGDAQIFCTTASYLFNYYSFARKYVTDLVDEQHIDGNIGQIAPYGGVDFYMRAMDGSAGWSDAVVLIPWKLYEQYGNVQILESFYAAMKRYAKYKQATVGKWYPTAIPTGVGIKNAFSICNFRQSYGEWAEPKDVCAFKTSDFVSPHPEETTAYIVYLMEHMEKIAKVLGKDDDARSYAKCADKVRRGYRALVKTKKFSLDTDRQAKQVRPLYMKLLDKEQTEFAKTRLLKGLDNYNWRLGTGFLSTPFILYVLSEMNKEYAYRLLENEEIPGWLSMPKNGANTIWEAWEGPNGAQEGIGSLNHYSKGAVLEWVFKVMCGISVDAENHFTIAPVPGGHFTSASLCYDSVYGTVSSSWKINGDVTTYQIEIPSNCTAKVIIGGETMELEPGRYEFEN